MSGQRDGRTDIPYFIGPSFQHQKVTQQKAFLIITEEFSFGEKMVNNRTNYVFNYLSIYYFRKQPPKVFYEKAVYTNSAIFTGKCL